ncbi:probable glutathione S-transferase isoform X1 [Olea europaea var. sylvestris]|uniref:Probable glutathione S-transferase n=1 Tax=Olea europaea subsp. europaea TaxID=158383 RepID=A0A8S0S498_OLEEU|nr:probable glutathione S-transferase isoform X1 [Olea europaea var. sylvestris]CAA2986531.1 probable glutathione S-transferase [Olea europaea subsp. europaea]
MAEVKLFGAWGSPFSRRIEVALKLKGVEYEFIDEDLFNKKSPLLLKYNPVHKKVPVLVHNGKPICESLVILEYIDETWEEGPSLLPKDPYERGMVRFWSKFLDEKCMPAMRRALLSRGEELEKATEESTELLKFLEGTLSGKKFFGGDNIGMVDIVANFISYWFIIGQELAGLQVLTKEKFPKLGEWMDEYLNSNIIKENLPQKDKLTAMFQARIEAAAAGGGGPGGGGGGGGGEGGGGGVAPK